MKTACRSGRDERVANPNIGESYKHALVSRKHVGHGTDNSIFTHLVPRKLQVGSFCFTGGGAIYSVLHVWSKTCADHMREEATLICFIDRAVVTWQDLTCQSRGASVRGT